MDERIVTAIRSAWADSSSLDGDPHLARDAAVDIAYLLQDRDRQRAAHLEEAARIADEYGHVWPKSATSQVARTIAARIRAVAARPGEQPADG